MFRKNFVAEIKTLILYPIIFSPKIMVFMGKWGKNMDEPEPHRRQITILYGATKRDLHAG
jgi:hypothetical protein